ncbi:AAA family ATPase [Wielerella bovis]|uniref:AAA family ATPase n=1 Tax=Wielerella bovis TaxID=2917790 RepID=UPI002019E1FF|nr:AAA family ATPase [Wielerella bovis]MCG7656612.1 ATP-binding protein [Wielerella bovis]MCG7658837.1 ATP-binding protein [Wielerella bovis]
MKFQLKNVGKIKDAEFELKPLTVFIGANGSGKTYAASALWGIMNYLENNIKNSNVKDLFPAEFYEEIYQKVESELLKLDNLQEIYIKFSIDEIQEIDKYIQENIFNNSANILNELFGFDGFRQSHLNITNELNSEHETNCYWTSFFYEDKDYWEFKANKESIKQKYLIPINKHDSIAVLSYIKDLDKYSKGITRLMLSGGLITEDFVNIVLTDVIFSMYFLSLKRLLGFGNVLYIPAARTGLMFITHDIVQSQFESINNFSFNKRSNKLRNNDLTAPLNDFIAKIHNASRPKSELNTENQSFNQIMGGKLVQREGQYRFDFQPNGLEQTVPLSASSSLVTELAALSALEENIGYGTFIILEEPEAHLHLSAQREMAKLIVRLINEKKCRILLTTHSDTFLQQINNLIMLEKLSRHNENALADFGIQAAEVIAADDVAVYDFQCVGNETRVENLACGEYGFVAKSMNDVLIALAKETQSIIEQIDDLEAE